MRRPRCTLDHACCRCNSTLPMPVLDTGCFYFILIFIFCLLLFCVLPSQTSQPALLNVQADCLFCTCRCRCSHPAYRGVTCSVRYPRCLPPLTHSPTSLMQQLGPLDAHFSFLRQARQLTHRIAPCTTQPADVARLHWTGHALLP